MAQLLVGAAMGRYLVVANQTLGGENLRRTVRDRIERDGGESHFHILVPLTAPEHEAGEWTHGFPVGEEEAWTPEQVQRLHQIAEESERRYERDTANARLRAEQRLEQMITEVHAAGGQADGRVGHPDPVRAATQALEDGSFDEVIVSTLPERISRWLRMDVPSRISRTVRIPVTTVEARGRS